LTDRRNRFIINLLKGGEVDEMDVSPCNPLFGLRLDMQVPSKTLNCSPIVGGKFQNEEF
jgi:hypothetical protein